MAISKMLTQRVAFLGLLNALLYYGGQSTARNANRIRREVPPFHFTQKQNFVGDSLRIEGLVTKPLWLSRGELASRPKTEVKARDRQGVEHTYVGIPLIDLLREAGATTGVALKGKNLSQVVLVQASDGYQVVFALPELDPLFSTQTILLAYQADGKPLPAGEGPFRVVVPQEKKPARWVRQVTTVKILVVKE